MALLPYHARAVTDGSARLGEVSPGDEREVRFRVQAWTQANWRERRLSSATETPENPRILLPRRESRARCPGWQVENGSKRFPKEPGEFFRERLSEKSRSPREKRLLSGGPGDCNEAVHALERRVGRRRGTRRT